MKKRLLSLFFIILILLMCSSSVLAQPLMTRDFNLFVKVSDDFGEFETCTFRFNLFLKNGTWLSNQFVDVSGPGMIKITFPIGVYPVGTEFNLVATTGIDSYTHYGSEYKLNDECLIGTYAFRETDGSLVICNESFIEVTPQTATNKYALEKHVNDMAIWSNTPYLIWVSKANYRVNVFYKENSKWNFVCDFPCSIGAASTPTVTGQYVYHQYQPKWQYDGYYVGPIMRFYRGYALHSTLVNNDGTDRDARVEKMISHGCVRLKPDDINWLVETIPIDTKVYVTEQ